MLVGAVWATVSWTNWLVSNCYLLLLIHCPCFEHAPLKSTRERDVNRTGQYLLTPWGTEFREKRIVADIVIYSVNKTTYIGNQY